MDLTKALAPKSDQLDFTDLDGSGPQVFTITAVSENGSELKDQQPVNIQLAEFPRVWRPSKGMLRVLADNWGKDPKVWAGRRVELYGDPDFSRVPAVGLLSPAYAAERRRRIDPLKADVGFQDVAVDESIGKLSLVGVGMRSHSGVAAKMFEALSKENINIGMISTSEIKISVLVELSTGEQALRAVHAAFLG